MKTAETPAGIFTINKVKIPSAYTCAAEQKIEYISENHMQIITMDQAVSFGDQDVYKRQDNVQKYFYMGREILDYSGKNLGDK